MKHKYLSAHCDYEVGQRKPLNNPAACLFPAIRRSSFQSIQDVRSVGGRTNQDPWIAYSMKRRITMMLLIIWTVSFLYTVLYFLCSTFIPISSSLSFNFIVLITHRLLNHGKKSLYFYASYCSFQHQENQMIYSRGESRWQYPHNTQQ